MPASDSLSICEAGLGACRSISTAVPTSASGRLGTLSVAAGKTAPYCMREFYGYNPVAVCACSCFQSGTEGVDPTVYKYVVFPPAPPQVGTSYYICLKGMMFPYQQAVGSYAYVQMCCNSVTVACVCHPGPAGVCTFDHGFTYDSNDVVRVLVYTRASNTACPGGTCAYVCICSVTSPVGNDYYLAAPFCVGVCTG